MPVDRLHSLVATGQFLAAYREAERLALDPALDPTLKAKVFIVGVRAAAGLREIYAAAKMAEKAVECAEYGDNWEDIGNARLASAFVYAELGDTSQALRFFDLFFQHLDRYPTLQRKTALAYYNMGFTRQQRKEYDEAIAAYQLSIEDYEKLGSRAGIVFCLHNSAWVKLLQNRPHESEPYLAQAEALIATLEVPEHQIAHLVVEALYLRQLGELERAKSLCEEVFQPGRQGVSPRYLTEAAWIMADISLEAGLINEASIFADLAISYALQEKDPHLMNLASEVRRKVLMTKSELRP